MQVFPAQSNTARRPRRLPPVCVLARMAWLPSQRCLRAVESGHVWPEPCKSTHRSAFVLYSVQFPDELFAFRDGQFDYPQVPVLGHPPGQVCFEFLFFFNILPLRNAPFACAVGMGQSLKRTDIGLVKALVIKDNYQDCATVRFTSVQDYTEATGRLDKANQRRNFHRGGEAVRHQYC